MNRCKWAGMVGSGKMQGIKVVSNKKQGVRDIVPLFIQLLYNIWQSSISFG